ncbi:conserved hypothetical protein [Halobacteriovorax marinus SJ]|uniref:Heme oxygenase n=1 Tax=Halobacteriovorax marinus (strain ATCC BAA-682 / DSM 15412 / SJ) TaxID=862908 RepID=E1X363_HALMS|nr:DUF3050 domain-containing protein [Halobacteriovorax marinus]CBW26893.1 conserved hypothetical protein [Halobacteriovorax marinus SJ]
MDKLLEEIDSLHKSLETHRVYQEINDLDALRIFMSFHVFAVWDFMSLLKSLQREITCVELPWRPSPYSKEIVRMINEIVLGEESDVDLQGKACDHFTLYLEAMREVGCSTEQIDSFLIDFDLSPLADEIKNFVSFNLGLALGDETHKVAAAFFYGREKLIPDMFDGLLSFLKKQSLHCPKLIYYIERHIELDGDEHSILAKKCLDELCAGDEEKLAQAYEVGKKSLELRVKLWDGVLKKLTNEDSLALS